MYIRVRCVISLRGVKFIFVFVWIYGCVWSSMNLTLSIILYYKNTYHCDPEMRVFVAFEGGGFPSLNGVKNPFARCMSPFPIFQVL